MRVWSMLLGAVLSVLLVVSAAWFWSNLPNRDFLHLLGAITYRDIVRDHDLFSLGVSGMAFAFMMSAVLAYIVIVSGFMDDHQFDEFMPAIVSVVIFSGLIGAVVGSIVANHTLIGSLLIGCVIGLLAILLSGDIGSGIVLAVVVSVVMALVTLFASPALVAVVGALVAGAVGVFLGYASGKLIESLLPDFDLQYSQSALFSLAFAFVLALAVAVALDAASQIDGQWLQQLLPLIFIMVGIVIVGLSFRPKHKKRKQSE